MEDKVNIFLDFVFVELVNKIYNILTEKEAAINDILDTPIYYGQPEISMLLLCKNNNKKELLLTIEKDERFFNSKNKNKKIWEENKSIIFDM